MKRGRCLPGMTVDSNDTNLASRVAAFSADHLAVIARTSGEAMSLAITSRIVSGVVIVYIAGRLCILDVTLRERMNEWLEKGHRAFVLNLANVPYIDSFGLSQLIIIWTSVRN